MAYAVMDARAKLAEALRLLREARAELPALPFVTAYLDQAIARLVVIVENADAVVDESC